MAQPAAYQLPDEPGDPIPITGTLVQQSDKAPLPFATIVIYSEGDSSMVDNAMTEEDGDFELSVPADGEYYVQIQYVGYADKVISDIDPDNAGDIIQLGQVALQSDAVALQEVEVTAERSQMELKLDRRVFNVGKDLTNAGTNAAEILDNVPSVTVDTEGNVSLRGSQGVRILVNGKPSGMLSGGDTEALLRMQGDMIESVEVITNPSARYEAEGEAGIINIVLKKNDDRGINGSFGATLGYPENFGASYSLNFRRDKLNFFSNFGVNYRRSPGGGNSTQRFFEGGVLDEYFTSQTDQLRGGIGADIQVGTDWFINDRNTITGSVLYRAGRDNNDATVIYRDLDANDNLLNQTTREAKETQNDHNLETALRYERTFANPDQKWTIDFKYILDDDTEIADYYETSTDRSEPLIQRSSNTEDEANLLLQTDYVHPINENLKFEGGLRAAVRTVNNDFLVEEENADGEFEALPEFNDQLKYTENIYAAYAISAAEFGPIGIQAGLRAELSDITAALLRSETRNDQDYLSLFPSASVSYSFSDKDQIQMSYSRRLSRPYFRRLLPFSNFNNPRNNNIGNPNLRPEFTDSYETGYLHYFDRGSILSSVYYRHTTGVIEELILPGEDGTSIEYPTNLSTRNSYGLEFNISYDLTDWWRFNTDLNFFRAITEGEFEDREFYADAFSWYGRANTRLDVGEAWQFQSSFRYRGPRNTPQGRQLSSYSWDIGAAVDIFGGKGTLTLTGRDLLNTRKRRSIIDTPDYQAESVFQWRQARQLVLRATYRLNQNKDRGSQPLGDGRGDGF